MSSVLGILILLLLAGAVFYRFSARTGDGPAKKTAAPESADKGEASTAPTPGSHKVRKVLQKLDKAREDKMASSLQEKLLYQVAPPNEDFSGRRAAMLNLITRNREGCNRLGVYGAPGQGKTAVTFQLVEGLKPFYPQAQLYFNFQWAAQSTSASDEAMAHVIASFSPEKKRPITPEELAHQYQSVLKGRQVILVFDNVPTVADLQALVPPAGVLLMVTANEKMALENMIWEEVDPLPAEDIRDMLTKLCSRLGFWMAELSKYCGQNTQALNLAARFLSEFSTLDPEVFATKLRDQFKNMEKGEADSSQAGIQAVLTLVYAVIADPLKVLLQRLTLFPATFDADAEQFICEDRENVKLETLVRVGLVECNAQTGRYYVPVSFLSWIKKRVNPGVKTQTETRLGTYYMTLLQGLHEKFQPNSAARRGQALQRFDWEWQNIRAGQAWAQSNALKDHDTARICHGYTDFGYPLLKLRQPAEVRLPWLEAGLLASQTLQDEEGERECLLNLGREQVQLKRFGAAVESLEKVLALTDETKDTRTALEAYHSLGQAHMGEKVWDKAQDRFLNARALAEQISQDGPLLRAEEALVDTFLKAEDPGQAVEWVERALVTARRIGDAKAEARLLTSLGEVKFQMGHMEEVVTAMQQAVKQAGTSADKATQGRMHRILGDAYSELNEPAKAASSYEQAAQLFAAARDWDRQACTLCRQGLCLMRAGDPDAGSKWVSQAVQLFAKIKPTEDEATLLEQVGQVHLEAGRWDPAVRMFRMACERSAKAGLKEPEARSLRALGQAFEGKGDRAEALKYFKTAAKRFEQAQSSEVAALKEHIQKLEKGVLQP